MFLLMRHLKLKNKQKSLNKINFNNKNNKFNNTSSNKGIKMANIKQLTC
jgi:hypothetical protein